MYGNTEDSGNLGSFLAIPEAVAVAPCIPIRIALNGASIGPDARMCL